MGLRVVVLLLVVGAAIRAADGIIGYWDADRACSEWRDNAWQKGGTGRMHFDSEVKRYGVASVRLEGLPDREISVSSVCARMPVKPDGKYVLRFWSRRVGAGGSASCQVLAHRVVDEQHTKAIGWVRLEGKERLEIAPSDDWQLHEVPLASLPGGTERVFFYFRVKGETTLWIDEFSLAEEGVKVELGGQPALTDADYAGIRLDEANLPGNLLVNGSFEEGMKGWQVMNPATPATVAAGPEAGTHCLQIIGKEFAAGGVYQRVQIDPRRSYRLSFRADGPKLVGYFFTKVLRFDRDNHPRGWLGGEVLYSAKSGEWAACSGEFTPSPSTDNIVVYLRVEDTIGEVRVDDVRLEPLPLAQP